MQITISESTLTLIWNYFTTKAAILKITDCCLHQNLHNKHTIGNKTSIGVSDSKSKNCENKVCRI